jgi:hypothetical protein
MLQWSYKKRKGRLSKMTKQELENKIKKLEKMHRKVLRAFINGDVEYSFYIQYVSVIEGLEVRAIENYCNSDFQYKGMKGSLPLYTLTNIADSIRIPYMALNELSHSLICHICDDSKLNKIWGKVVIG